MTSSLEDLLEVAIRRLEADPSAIPSFAQIAEVARTRETTDRPLGIAEVADRTGITAHTLRYYERIGLVSTPRHLNGRRYYDEAALQRVVFIARMRSSGMGLRDLLRYLELTDRGDEEAGIECAAILLRHRAALRRKVAELQLALAITDFKIAHLDDHAGRTGVPDPHLPTNGADQ
ncbi:MerR family transcriptional regulator [Ammonicoccus fulvus]|uniref:MerR family transcriptional regulator n=1 Tax=Ammonicoccus fulvus TaxID=3138240 RepID=A0ABZ3FR04_9ACTN